MQEDNGDENENVENVIPASPIIGVSEEFEEEDEWLGLPPEDIGDSAIELGPDDLLRQLQQVPDADGLPTTSDARTTDKGDMQMYRVTGYAKSQPSILKTQFCKDNGEKDVKHDSVSIKSSSDSKSVDKSKFGTSCKKQRLSASTKQKSRENLLLQQAWLLGWVSWLQTINDRVIEGALPVNLKGGTVYSQSTITQLPLLQGICLSAYLVFCSSMQKLGTGSNKQRALATQLRQIFKECRDSEKEKQGNDNVVNQRSNLERSSAVKGLNPQSGNEACVVGTSFNNNKPRLLGCKQNSDDCFIPYDAVSAFCFIASTLRILRGSIGKNPFFYSPAALSGSAKTAAKARAAAAHALNISAKTAKQNNADEWLSKAIEGAKTAKEASVAAKLVAPLVNKTRFGGRIKQTENVLKSKNEFRCCSNGHYNMSSKYYPGFCSGRLLHKATRALHLKEASPAMASLLFVALCRAFGLKARLAVALAPFPSIQNDLRDVSWLARRFKAASLPLPPEIDLELKQSQKSKRGILQGSISGGVDFYQPCSCDELIPLREGNNDYSPNCRQTKNDDISIVKKPYCSAYCNSKCRKNIFDEASLALNLPWSRSEELHVLNSNGQNVRVFAEVFCPRRRRWIACLFDYPLGFKFDAETSLSGTSASPQPYIYAPDAKDQGHNPTSDAAAQAAAKQYGLYFLKHCCQIQRNTLNKIRGEAHGSKSALAEGHEYIALPEGKNSTQEKKDNVGKSGFFFGLKPKRQSDSASSLSDSGISSEEEVARTGNRSASNTSENVESALFKVRRTEGGTLVKSICAPTDLDEATNIFKDSVATKLENTGESNNRRCTGCPRTLTFPLSVVLQGLFLLFTKKDMLYVFVQPITEPISRRIPGYFMKLLWDLYERLQQETLPIIQRILEQAVDLAQADDQSAEITEEDVRYLRNGECSRGALELCRTGGEALRTPYEDLEARNMLADELGASWNKTKGKKNLNFGQQPSSLSPRDSKSKMSSPGSQKGHLEVVRGASENCQGNGTSDRTSINATFPEVRVRGRLGLGVGCSGQSIGSSFARKKALSYIPNSVRQEMTVSQTTIVVCEQPQIGKSENEKQQKGNILPLAQAGANQVRFVLAVDSGGGIRDVTRRYTQSWHRVLQSRGRRLHEWWSSTRTQSAVQRRNIQNLPRLDEHIAAIERHDMNASGDQDTDDGNSDGIWESSSGSETENESQKQQTQLETKEPPLHGDELACEEYEMEKSLDREPMPKSRRQFVGNPKYALSSMLKNTEYLRPGSKMVGVFEGERVYLRKDVVSLKTERQWRRLLRNVKEGETPLKKMKLNIRFTGQRHVLGPGYQLPHSNWGASSSHLSTNRAIKQYPHLLWKEMQQHHKLQSELQELSQYHQGTPKERSNKSHTFYYPKKTNSTKLSNNMLENEKQDNTKEVGLFAEWQTIAMETPVVVNGELPVGEYGDVEVGTLGPVPKGAVHLSVMALLVQAKETGIQTPLSQSSSPTPQVFLYKESLIKYCSLLSVASLEHALRSAALDICGKSEETKRWARAVVSFEKSSNTNQSFNSTTHNVAARWMPKMDGIVVVAGAASAVCDKWTEICNERYLLAEKTRTKRMYEYHRQSILKWRVLLKSIIYHYKFNEINTEKDKSELENRMKKQKKESKLKAIEKYSASSGNENNAKMDLEDNEMFAENKNNQRTGNDKTLFENYEEDWEEI